MEIENKEKNFFSFLGFGIFEIKKKEFLSRNYYYYYYSF